MRPLVLPTPTLRCRNDIISKRARDVATAVPPPDGYFLSLAPLSRGAAVAPRHHSEKSNSTAHSRTSAGTASFGLQNAAVASVRRMSKDERLLQLQPRCPLPHNAGVAPPMPYDVSLKVSLDPLPKTVPPAFALRVLPFHQGMLLDVSDVQTSVLVHSNSSFEWAENTIKCVISLLHCHLPHFCAVMII